MLARTRRRPAAGPATRPTSVEGFSPYLVIKGIARVEEGGAVSVLRNITNGQFPPPGDDYPAVFVTRISPRKISGTGPWGLAD